MQRSLVASLALSSLALAQAPTIFSPTPAATSLGNSNNSIPFSWTPVSYQQIHNLTSFVGGAAPITQMRFRMASGFANTLGATVDLEIFMSECPTTHTTYSTTFANNITPGTEVNVFPRAMVLLPQAPNNDWVIAPFPLSTPFPFTALANISWRANVYGNSRGNAIFTYPLDVFQGTGTSVITGGAAGCRAATATNVATHTTSIPAPGGNASFTGNSFVVAGGLPALLTIGASSTHFAGAPILPFDLGPAGAPGCFIRNDWIAIIAGVTNANTNGSVVISITTPPDPALERAVFYSQYLFVDLAANALGVFATNGRQNTFGFITGTTRLYATGGPGLPTANGVGTNYGLSIGLN